MHTSVSYVTDRTLALYRILAYTTGVILLVFTVEIVGKYGFGVEGYEWIALIHGWVYLAYFLVTVSLAYKHAWPLQWSIPVLLAGTIPLMSFIAERKVVAKVQAESRLPVSAPGETA